jgi:hypothetical protein
VPHPEPKGVTTYTDALNCITMCTKLNAIKGRISPIDHEKIQK